MTDTATNPTPLVAPVQFLGIQPGFRDEAAIELYILLSPVGEHPVGSTVSRRTLERHGYNLMPERPETSAIKARQAGPVA